MFDKLRSAVIRLSVFVLAITGLTAAVLAAPAAKDPKSLRIGIDRAHPPFSWIDPEQGAQGFDVAIGKALCARMQVNCEFIADTRDALIGNLLARRTDAVIASLPITDEAKKTIDFTDRYEAASGRFVMARSTEIAEPTPEALKDKIVGVLVGSRYLRYLDAIYAPRGVIVRTLATPDALHTELQAGRIQAIFDDPVELYGWFDTGSGARCCRFVGTAVKDAKWLGDGAGIAVRREDQGLRDAFNRALSEIRRDGSYEKLNAAYLPFLLY
jgi:polar amino acid transport system substrate-binding protein